MNRDKARDLFNELGLDYSKISELEIRKLSNILEAHLIGYLATGDFHASQMDMKVSPLLKKDLIMKDGKLVSARITIDGRYFKRREGITFSETGWIGFAGEFSDVNTAPILRAFCNWCYNVNVIEKMERML